MAAVPLSDDFVDRMSSIDVATAATGTDTSAEGGVGTKSPPKRKHYTGKFGRCRDIGQQQDEKEIGGANNNNGRHDKKRAKSPKKLSKSQLAQVTSAAAEGRAAAEAASGLLAFVMDLTKVDGKAKFNVPRAVVDAAIAAFREGAPQAALLLVTCGPTRVQIAIDIPAGFAEAVAEAKAKAKAAAEAKAKAKAAAESGAEAAAEAEAEAEDEAEAAVAVVAVRASDWMQAACPRQEWHEWQESYCGDPQTASSAFGSSNISADETYKIVDDVRSAAFAWLKRAHDIDLFAMVEEEYECPFSLDDF